MEPRKINLFERKGVMSLIKEYCEIDVENILCGTCEDGMINVQNTYLEFPVSNEHPVLGKVGIAENDDILFYCLNDDESEGQMYKTTYPDFRFTKCDG